MAVLQLDMFRDDDVSNLEQRVLNMEDSLSRNRKCLHAKHGELKKMYMDIEARLTIIERGLCNGKI